jgi:D-lactate dehydrogenase (cytochrome)
MLQPVAGRYEDFLTDESKKRGAAEYIAFPRSTEEIAAACREACARGLPITVQGGRTGIAAGAVPGGGCIINLSRMDRILGLRYDAYTGECFCTVQPGVTLKKLAEAIDSRDFEVGGWSADSRAALEAMQKGPPQFFAPDPTETSASVGGMIACNASGARSYAYGSTRRYVHAVDAVLTDGSTVRLGRDGPRATGRRFSLAAGNGRIIEGALPAYNFPHVKNAAGYYAAADMDLLDLIIGSDGTLCIIAQAELRLMPRPAQIWGMMAFLPDDAAAVGFVRAVRGEKTGAAPAAENRPAAIEFFNADALDLLRNLQREDPAFASLPKAPEGNLDAVYVEYHAGTEDEAERVVTAASEIMAQCGGSEDTAWLATDAHELERLKQLRHALPESVNTIISRRQREFPELTKLGTDMSAPDDRLGDLLTMYAADLRAAGLESVVFGHIGDNHLHVNILPRSSTEYAAGKELYLAWARTIMSWGGSVSAEHGIGKMKKEFLHLMYGDKGIGEMLSVKKAFDPDGRLNPGNLF